MRDTNDGKQCNSAVGGHFPPVHFLTAGWRASFEFSCSEAEQAKLFCLCWGVWGLVSAVGGLPINRLRNVCERRCNSGVITLAF